MQMSGKFYAPQHKKRTPVAIRFQLVLGVLKSRIISCPFLRNNPTLTYMEIRFTNTPKLTKNVIKLNWRKHEVKAEKITLQSREIYVTWSIEKEKNKAKTSVMKWVTTVTDCQIALSEKILLWYLRPVCCVDSCLLLLRYQGPRHTPRMHSSLQAYC
jgi:hypothetical protein